jgi:GT2 family glycosyltransferase
MTQTTAPLVSLIIVNWNGRHWLEQCLPTLQAQTFADFEIIVVDNGSSDGSPAWLQAEWPSVRLICLPENAGFARANNVGIAASAAPYIVTLNNDTLADPGWLAAMVAAVDAPEIGMVACQMVMWDSPHLLDSAGIKLDWSGTGWNRGAGRPTSAFSEPELIFGPCAGAALYRRQMLNEIGLFDEDFFAYYEDVDLAWRGQQNGWRCRYQPAAQVRHWHSATGGRNLARKTFLLGRNKWLTIYKNYPWPALLWGWPFVMLADCAALLYNCLRQRDLSALRGRLAALPALGQMWRKRRGPYALYPAYMRPPLLP